jgi:hypothetical protein
VGQVFAKDIDKGENAVIDYEIIDGNDGRIFGIQQGTNNQGIITVDRRLDREMAGQYLITIKCFRPYERNVKSQRSKYNSAVSFAIIGGFRRKSQMDA